MQTRSPKEKYLFFYFNLPYAFPQEKFPSKITLELNNYCNFQCTHCHRYVANENRPPGELTFDLFSKIIAEIREHPATILKIGGWGEPTLHPDFRKMIMHSAEQQIRTYLFTNGTVFKALSFTDLLELTGTVMVISVDGSDRGTYERIRIGGKYDDLKNYIQNFYQFRNHIGKSFPRIVIQKVVFPEETHAELERFRNSWSLSTDAVDFCVFNPLEKILLPAAQNGRSKRCKRIRREISIMHNGEIPVCGPQTKFKDCEYVGNIRDESIYEIWNNQRMIHIRELLKAKTFADLPNCERCIYYR